MRISILLFITYLFHYFLTYFSFPLHSLHFFFFSFLSFSHFSPSFLSLSIGGTSDVSMIIENLSGGILGIASTHRGYIVALCGNKNSNIGMIRTRLIAISNYFVRVFDQIK